MTASDQEMHLFIFPRTSSLFLYARYIACDVMRMRCASLSSSFSYVDAGGGNKKQMGKQMHPFFLAMHRLHNFPLFKGKKVVIFLLNLRTGSDVRAIFKYLEKGRFYSEKRAHPSIKEIVFPAFSPFQRSEEAGRGG